MVRELDESPGISVGERRMVYRGRHTGRTFDWASRCDGRNAESTPDLGHRTGTRPAGHPACGPPIDRLSTRAVACIIFRAIGIPTSMFTVLFAVAPTVGWIS